MIGAVSTLTASAQIKFAAIPEVSVGWTQLPKDLDNSNAVHAGVGATIGIAEYDNSWNANGFVGAYFSIDGYSFNADISDGNYKAKDVSCTAASYTLGINALARMDNGFSFGALIGYKFWASTIDVDGTSVDCEIESNITNNVAAKLKAGYGWTHALLLFEVGFDGGPTAGLNVAFPIYKD